MIIDNKEWIPIKEFLIKYNITKNQLYNRTRCGYWYDGFVVKKNPNTGTWILACEKDYLEWLTVKQN